MRKPWAHCARRSASTTGTLKQRLPAIKRYWTVAQMLFVYENVYEFLLDFSGSLILKSSLIKFSLLSVSCLLCFYCRTLSNQLKKRRRRMTSAVVSLLLYCWAAVDCHKVMLMVMVCLESSSFALSLLVWCVGSSSESDDDDGVTAKSFMKKKPQEEEKAAPEASKFLKGAAVSPNSHVCQAI